MTPSIQADHDPSDFEVVGEASEGLVAIEMAKKLMPDVVLMDVNMGGMNGIEDPRAIRSTLPSVQSELPRLALCAA